MTRKVVVIGAGGHAKVVISTAQAMGMQVVALYDDGSPIGREILGVRVTGATAEAENCGYPAVIGIGSNAVRSSLAAQIGCEWATLVHPAATVHESVVLGPGTVIFAGVVVQPDTHIGGQAILNTGCSVDHDCIIGDAVHIGPGARLCGGVSIGEGTLVGVGAAVIPGVSIGRWSVVGAGAAVVGKHGANERLLGVPARSMK